MKGFEGKARLETEKGKWSKKVIRKRSSGGL